MSAGHGAGQSRFVIRQAYMTTELFDAAMESKQYVAITTRKDIRHLGKQEVCFDAFCLRPGNICRAMPQCQDRLTGNSLDAVQKYLKRCNALLYSPTFAVRATRQSCSRGFVLLHVLGAPYPQAS